jgi:hypothetical protein
MYLLAVTETLFLKPKVLDVAIYWPRGRGRATFRNEVNK